jgi:hypothetical protein
MNSSSTALLIVLGILLGGVGSWAELPIPENPLWEPVRDEVYLQEVGRKVETKEPVTAAAVLDGALYTGSRRGVRRLEGDKLVDAGGPSGQIVRLKTLGGALWAFPEKGLWRYADGAWKKLGDAVFTDACEHLGGVVAASRDHLYRVDGDTLAQIDDIDGTRPILGVASYAETLYVRHAKQVGFLRYGQLEYDDAQDWGHLPHHSTTRDLMGLGSRLFVPTDRGLAVLRGMSWYHVTGEDGLCYEDTTCITRGFEREDYWIGTMRGAIRVVNREYQYFGYQRWIPHDKVNAIAVGDQVVYIATDGGLGIIEYEPYTLQKKAAWYERWIDEWGMRRIGFISTLYWDADRGEWIRFISDNDGGWVCHLMNAYSFKYAVTKDPAAREAAVEIFRSLRWLDDITPMEGFPARSIATINEPSLLAATGSAGLPSEWNRSTDGEFLWKGDTSSDEIDSHIQSTTIFYEAAAQGKDKEAAREHMNRVVGHIVDNGYVLRDMDGRPTRWARWDVAYLQKPYGYSARGLNGMEALGMMNAALAITGNEKFAVAKDQLLDWGYHNEALRQLLVFPEFTHFDDRLGFLAYHPLLSYETDPQLRSIYRRSLERSWEIKRVGNMVWFNYIYGGLTGNEMDNRRSLENLRAWPLDCISYTYVNSHRADLHVPEGYVNYVCDWKSLTARDIGPQRWDGDFFALDGGGNGKGVHDPSAFLDAYWMARYYGMIQAPDVTDPGLLTVEHRGLQLGAKPYDGPPRPDIFDW